MAFIRETLITAFQMAALEDKEAILDKLIATYEVQ